MDYDQALRQLEYPDSWCEGAKTLAAIGDPQALLPLVVAYEQRFEASRRCLLDAMAALQPGPGAHDLFDRSSGEQRRIAVHLMELFASNDHLSRLTLAASDPDPYVRAQAQSALAGQIQTPEWEVTMITLLGHTDSRMRAQALKSLSRRLNHAVRSALQIRLGIETDSSLKEDIERILAETPS